MTTPTPVRSVPVTVAVLGPTAPPAAALAAVLRSAPPGRLSWRVVAGDPVRDLVAVDIVVCDDLGTAAAAAQRWPAAAVVALVPPRHRTPEVDARVLCLTGGDVGLVAAYVQSLARRRGPTGEDTRPPTHRGPAGEDVRPPAHLRGRAGQDAGR